jgi:hypothetical protein
MGCPWASPPSRRDDSWIGPATTLWLHQACGSRPSSGSITGAAGTWNAAVLAIRTALETVGAEFIADNGGGQGVRLRKQTGEPFGARPHIPSCPFITSSRICESPRGPNGRSRGPPLDRRRCGLSSPVRTRKPGPKPRGSTRWRAFRPTPRPRRRFAGRPARRPRKASNRMPKFQSVEEPDVPSAERWTIEQIIPGEKPVPVPYFGRRTEVEAEIIRWNGGGKIEPKAPVGTRRRCPGRER